MKFLINRKVTISMIFIALSFLGWISYGRLSVELLPTTELPVISVNVSAQSFYDPRYIESDVVIPLEGVVAKNSGIEKITSLAWSRGARVIVEFKPGVDMQATSIKFTEEVNQASRDLPDGFNVNVIRANSSRSYSNQFMTLSVKGEGTVDEIRAIVEEDLLSRLENVDGIVGVNLYGGRERSVEVELNDALTQSLGITPSSVVQSISSAAAERNFAGYSSGRGGQDLGVFIEGGYNDVELIGDIVVSEGPVFLKDVATVRSELLEPTSISRVDGKRAITLGLNNESGANLIEVAEAVEKEIALLNAQFAHQSISIEVASSNAEQIEENIDQIANLGVTGAVLAILILWFFLHNISMAMAISLAIPISVFSAFNLFYAFDISLNSFTLIGIALAVGMLLDNSIIVLENIYRLYGAGRSAKDAVIEGTSQVWRSIIASTLTTITVFLPFIFTDNIVVQLLGKNLGVAIISTLAFSLCVALLFIPMVTYLILRSGKSKGAVFAKRASTNERIIQIYTIFLKNVIRRPAVVITTMMFVLLVTFMWAFSGGDQGNRSVGSDQISIYAEMDESSTIAANDDRVAIIEGRVDSLPEKEQIRSMVNQESATVTITLRDGFDDRGGRKIGDIIDDVWGRLGQVEGVVNMNVTSGVSSSGGSSGMDFMGQMLGQMGIGEQTSSLKLVGTDYEEMIRVAEDLEDRIEELDFVANANASVRRGQREVDIVLDPVTSSALGIGRGQLSSGLASINDELSSGTQIKIDDDYIDIVVSKERKDSLRTDFRDLKDLNELRALTVQNADGALYRLGDISTIRQRFGRGNIQRIDRSREITINYRYLQSDLTEDILAGYQAEIDALVAEYPLPTGMAVEVVEPEDSLEDFTFLIIAALILIYMIMAIVFESVSLPFVLMFAIPLAAIGSFVALILSGNSLLNINTMTGFLILLGVVVNGGIILIDYTNYLRRKGYSRNRALIMSGASRLKPIMITTVTTIVALLPLALGDTEYAGAIGAPFAITVIGGLAFSSVLTLILIPTLYMSMESILQWYRELPRWMYVVHSGAMGVVVFYVMTTVSGVFAQGVYVMFAVALIPGITYLIRSSIRIANSRIIEPGEPITIEVRNLVKIYDRPSKIKREWMGAKGLRRRLGLDTDCQKLSDLKDLLWKAVIMVVLYVGGLMYFENKLWITLCFVLWASLSMGMWRKVFKYRSFKNGGKPSKFLRIINRTLPVIVAVVALVSFASSSGSAGVTVLYVFMMLFFYLLYRLARKAEKRNITVERINGRFSTIRRTFYSMALAMPFIGKRTTPFMALKGVSFTIQNGMFGLLGSNGAGKSTFMRILTGILTQSYGTIWINGKDTREYREELQSLIGFLPQEFGTYEDMSAWKFLDYQALLKGLTTTELRHERLEYVLKAVHMWERKDAKISSFSGGMKQRIGIALILLNLPRILVVDEPTAGLDPRERIRFRNLLVELAQERIVIFSTHIIEDIASSCNQVVVINRGELRYFGDPAQMMSYAQGKVWSFTCSEAEFEALDHTRVANHMRDTGGRIRIRYISVDQPSQDAVREIESLEDAYLCLLKKL